MSIFTLSAAIVLLTASIVLLKKVDNHLRLRSQKAYITGALREQTRYAMAAPENDFGRRVHAARAIEPIGYLEEHRLGA